MDTPPPDGRPGRLRLVPPHGARPVNRPVPLGDPAPPPRRALADVMRKVAQGDQQAFSTLYDALAPMVFGIAVRVLRDRAQSEEVAQEVMIDLWRQAARYQPAAGSVTAWAATIAHRRAVDRVRSAQAAADREHARAAREHATAVGLTLEPTGGSPRPTTSPLLLLALPA
ncbi:sigma factor [Streptomyces sp. NPDC056503]|uniref:sigma factor n=1 Tax=Streptomyces sp. NPDC056503 TaxID=3345842 RepID=UPI0036B1EACE